MRTNDFTDDYVSMTGQYPSRDSRLDPPKTVIMGEVPPENPLLGTVWFNKRLYIFDGSTWVRPGGEKWTS